MKTYKVYLRNYLTESIQSENFAVDDHNNLSVGGNLFHSDMWSHIVFLYENENQLGIYDNPDFPYESAQAYNPAPAEYTYGAGSSGPYS